MFIIFISNFTILQKIQFIWSRLIKVDLFFDLIGFSTVGISCFLNRIAKSINETTRVVCFAKIIYRV